MRESPDLRPVARRGFILRNLQRNGELAMKDIYAAFPGVARQSVRDDIEALTELGFEIDPERRGRETVLVHPDPRLDVEEEDVRVKQKRMVASLCAGLICGFYHSVEEAESIHGEQLRPEDPLLEIPLAPPPPWCKNIHSVAEILASRRILHGASRSWEDVVFPALQDFWGHTNRIVAVDAGSTNLKTAELLSKIKVPCDFSILTALSVCTNGRKAFHLIGDQDVRIRAIVVGGQQIRRTSIIAGRLAEQFLSEASSLHFGISLIGAIALNVRDNFCKTNTQEEVGMKALFMQKSSLKVVCLDNKKIIKRAHRLMRSGFNFVPLHPRYIDLIVTNRPLRADELPPEATEQQHQAALAEEKSGEFDEMIEMINRRGIPCLVSARGPGLVEEATEENPSTNTAEDDPTT